MARTRNLIPTARVPLVGGNGLPTTEWYRFFSSFIRDTEEGVADAQGAIIAPDAGGTADVAAAIADAIIQEATLGPAAPGVDVLANLQRALEAVAIRPYGASLEDLAALRNALTKAIADIVANMPDTSAQLILPGPEQDTRFGSMMRRATPRINQMPIGRNNQGDLAFITAGLFGQLLMGASDLVTARSFLRVFLYRATRSATLTVNADTDTELTWSSEGPAANGYTQGDMSMLNGRLWSTDSGVKTYDIKALRIVTNGAADFVVTYFAASNGGAENADNGKLPVKVRAIIPSAGRWKIDTPGLVDLANVTSASTLGIRFRTPPGAASVNITSAVVDVEQRY